MTIFDPCSQEYDRWFDENEGIYQAEVNPLRRGIPQPGISIEFGAGTGHFSIPLAISAGVEPIRQIALIANHLGLKICQVTGELLPRERFDCTLLVMVICFITEVLVLLREIHGVLEPNGLLINGFSFKGIALDRVFESQKDSSKFYMLARIYSAGQVPSCT